MPTRKQRRRELKAQRHDYEFVYVDGEGNELDEVPEELEQPKKERSNGSKPAAAKKGQPAQRGRRQPPAGRPHHRQEAMAWPEVSSRGPWQWLQRACFRQRMQARDGA